MKLSMKIERMNVENNVGKRVIEGRGGGGES